MNFISQKIVKTNKNHTCWGCARLFLKGTMMQAVVSADGGEISRVYWCDDCKEILDSLDHIDCEDGFSFGELNDDYYKELVQSKA